MNRHRKLTSRRGGFAAILFILFSFFPDLLNATNVASLHMGIGKIKFGACFLSGLGVDIASIFFGVLFGKILIDFIVLAGYVLSQAKNSKYDRQYAYAITFVSIIIAILFPLILILIEIPQLSLNCRGTILSIIAGLVYSGIPLGGLIITGIVLGAFIFRKTSVSKPKSLVRE